MARKKTRGRPRKAWPPAFTPVEGQKMLRCPRCEERFPFTADFFYVNHLGNPLMYGECRGCGRERRRKHYHTSRDKVGTDPRDELEAIATEETRQCRCCRVTLPFTEDFFYGKKGRICKQCTIAVNRYRKVVPYLTVEKVGDALRNEARGQVRLRATFDRLLAKRKEEGEES